MTVRGGGEKIDYFFSLGQLGQEGILTYGNDSYERFNIRANLTAYINDKLAIRLNLHSISLKKIGYIFIQEKGLPGMIW